MTEELKKQSTGASEEPVGRNLRRAESPTRKVQGTMDLVEKLVPSGLGGPAKH